MSIIPDNLAYTESDEWVEKKDELCTIGVTDHAQEELTDIVQVYDLPEVGSQIKKGDVIATLESVKASSEVYSPVSGTVEKVNSQLEDKPELINEDPYGEGWIVQIKISDASEMDALMDAGKYKSHIEE